MRSFTHHWETVWPNKNGWVYLFPLFGKWDPNAKESAMNEKSQFYHLPDCCRCRCAIVHGSVAFHCSLLFGQIWSGQTNHGNIILSITSFYVDHHHLSWLWFGCTMLNVTFSNGLENIRTQIDNGKWYIRFAATQIPNKFFIFKFTINKINYFIFIIYYCCCCVFPRWVMYSTLNYTTQFDSSLFRSGQHRSTNGSVYNFHFFFSAIRSSLSLLIVACFFGKNNGVIKINLNDFPFSTCIKTTNVMACDVADVWCLMVKCACK